MQNDAFKDNNTDMVRSEFTYCVLWNKIVAYQHDISQFNLKSVWYNTYVLSLGLKIRAKCTVPLFVGKKCAYT